MTVTVITAATRLDLLPECIQSVKEQTVLPQAHLIGVDHARQGHATIRNVLAEGVTTEFIAFLDDDDVFLPNHLEVLLDSEADIRYSRALVSGRPWNPAYETPIEDLSKDNFIPVTVLMRTDLFKKVGGFRKEHEPTDDWDLWLRCQQLGATFDFKDTVTWRYRFQPDSVSLKPEPILPENGYEMCGRCGAAWKPESPDLVCPACGARIVLLTP